MPRLPSYRDVGNISPAVQRDPGVSAPVEAFQSTGGIVAQEFAPSLKLISEVVKKEEELKDNAAGNDFRRKLLELETEKDEWLSRQNGENIFDAKSKLDKDIEARVAKIKEGLKNDRQRNLAKEIEADWRVGVNRKSSRYIVAEMDRHYDNVDNKLVETSSRAAQKSASIGDFTRVQKEWADQEKVIAGLADRKGMSPVQRQDMLADRKSKFHSGIVLQLVADDKDIIANDYFVANKSDIDTESQFTLGKQLEIGNTRAAAQTLSDQYMAKHNNNFGLAVEEARKIKNPKVREATLSNIRQAKSDNEAAIKLNEDDAFTSAMQVVQEHGNVNKIDAATLVRVGVDGQNTLEKMALEVREKRTPTTDIKVWNEFSEKAKDRNWLAGLPEKEFAGYLFSFDEEKRDRASALRDAAKKAAQGDAKAKDFLRNDLNLSEVVKNKISSAGIIGKDKKLTEEDKRLISDIELQASKDLEALQVTNKRKATTQEEEDVVRGLLLPHLKVRIERDYWYDPEKRIGELNQEELSKAYVEYKNVPTEDRTFLANRASALGIKNASEDRIAKAYTAIIKSTDLPPAHRRAMIDAILRGK